MKQHERVSVNPQTELTYEKLKKYKGFENITEAQAEKEIETINRLIKVLYYLYVYEEQTAKKSNHENRP